MTVTLSGSLGIKTAGGSVVEVLDFKSQKASANVFTTIVDGQRRASFDFFYRNRHNVDWVYLQSLLLERIPPARAGDPELIVRLNYDGLATVALEMDDPVREEPRYFVLDTQILLSRCPGAQSGGPVDLSPGAPAVDRTAVAQQTHNRLCPGEKGSRTRPDSPDSRSRAGPGHARAGIWWIALTAVAAGCILIAVLLGPRLLAPILPSARAAAAGWLKPETEVRPGPPTNTPTTPPPVSAGGPKRSPAGGPGTGLQLATVGSQVPQASGPHPTQKRPSTDQSAPAPGSQVAERQPHRQASRHQIAWGDTLWRIAERYYGDRSLYFELADSNSLVDPDFIVAGQSLKLPPVLRSRPIITPVGNEAAQSEGR